MIVLTALAGRRAGGDTWDTFRAESVRLARISPTVYVSSVRLS